MDNIGIKNKIKDTLDKLDNMAYGVETRLKTLPPNLHHYKLLVEQLIDNLLHVEDDNIIEITDKIRSIRDNQLRELFLNKDDSFEKYGVNKEIENVTYLIHMHIDILFK